MRTGNTDTSIAPTLRRQLGAALLAIGFVLAVLAPSASAHLGRAEVAAFGADGTSASTFPAVGDLAFHDATRRLYVVAADSIEVSTLVAFDASNPPAFPPLAGFGPLSLNRFDGSVGVDNTTTPTAGHVFFSVLNGGAPEGPIAGYDSTGAPLGGAFPIDPMVNPGEPYGGNLQIHGIAVDSAGDVWVAQYGKSYILHYSPAGVFIDAVDTSGLKIVTSTNPLYPSAIAFDSEDNLYVGGGGGSSSDAAWKLTAASGYSSATLLETGHIRGIAVDRATDHVLVITAEQRVKEYDSSGALLATFAPDAVGVSLDGITVDSTNGYVYLADRTAKQVRVFGALSTFPDVSTGTPTAVGNTEATVSGSVDPDGVTLTECSFEFVTAKAFGESGFSDLSSGGSAACTPSAGSIPADEGPQAVSATLTGLEMGVDYRFRLSAGNVNGDSKGENVGFSTTAPPLVETMGSPMRTATTIRLDAMVNPRNAPATYHFEYGPTTAYGSSTPAEPAGSGDELELVSARAQGLQPGTTYHYRVVADNGNPLGPVFGEDRQMTTFAGDAPLSHGVLAGPPGSDRNWEQVNMDDTGGNPLYGALAIADSGERVVYQVMGGTPESEAGSAFNMVYSERDAAGWHTRALYPTRSEETGTWAPPLATDDLSMVTSMATTTGGAFVSFWRMPLGGPPSKLAEFEGASYKGALMVSDDGSRVLADLEGFFDPAHPVAPAHRNLYDLTSGAPQLVGLLPDGSLPSCGVDVGHGAGFIGQRGNSQSPLRAAHWLSPDGSSLVFPSRGNTAPCAGALVRLFVRDLPGEETTAIPSTPISGPACNADFLKQTVAADAVFFSTAARLVSADTPASGCNTGRDVYRYDVDSEMLDCVTCVVPGVAANVFSGEFPGNNDLIGVADDGSRVYFISASKLVPGAPASGVPGEAATYRVDVESGDVALVGRLGTGGIGGQADSFSALSPDGSVLLFRGNSAWLNGHGGSDNDGTQQYYRYDDENRSLVCLSCPPDGSAPAGPITGGSTEKPLTGWEQVAPNLNMLTADGDVIFDAPSPLVPEDENTASGGEKPAAGTDIYEWRNGRLLLISDGQTKWPSQSAVPEVNGVSPDGRSVFFSAPAALTPDALDAFRRLYVARIGGGFAFPVDPPPCPLEACQGPPTPFPADPLPGSSEFYGAGNVVPGKTCRKGTRKVRRHGKVRCVKKTCRKGTRKVRRHGKVRCVKKKQGNKKRNHAKGGRR
jgi:hypothetical protein